MIAVCAIALNVGCVFGSETRFLISNYPSQEYIVSTATYYHGTCEVSIRQVSPRIQGKNGAQVHGCRAWISVAKSSITVFDKYISDIDAVGAAYGIFVPAAQPDPRYFVFLKLGDYDGRMFILDKKCGVRNVVGGKYFVTKDSRYLLNVYSSDISGLSVFDYLTGKVIYEQNGIAGINHFFAWYTDGVRYFATEATPAPSGGETTENRKYVYRFSFTKKELVKEGTTNMTFAGVKRVDYLFDPQLLRLPGCCSFPCAPRGRN